MALGTDFSITRRVQYSETDAAGVLYFANYFRYMEEVEHAFWRSIGLRIVSPAGDPTILWPRVSVACEYFAPARFEDELTLRLHVTHVGNRSVAYEIEFLHEGRSIARGKVTAVCCEAREGRFSPTEIPAAVRSEFLSALQSPSAR